MKGVVFTELLEMVEQLFGYEVVDFVVSDDSLASGGIYTAVGTYSHKELVTLVMRLHQKTEIPVRDLLLTYGRHLFGFFTVQYKHFFEVSQGAFDLLRNVEDYIHVEVRKLYPDAELPRFQTRMLGDDCLEMVYYSDRAMADFAEGLIGGALEFYEEEAYIERTDRDPSGKEVVFLIKKK